MGDLAFVLLDELKHTLELLTSICLCALVSTAEICKRSEAVFKSIFFYGLPLEVKREIIVRLLFLRNTGIDYSSFHLLASQNFADGLKKYDIDVYKIKIGDVLQVHPSIWSVTFSKKHNLPEKDDDNYKYNYRVKDIEVTMYSRNPKADGTTPMLRVDITLERA